MRKHKRFIFVLMGFILLFSTSCADADQSVSLADSEASETGQTTTTINSTENTETENSRFKDQIGTIEVDLEIPELTESSFTTKKSKFHSFTLEEILTNLQLENTSWEQETIEADGSILTRAWNNRGDKITISSGTSSFYTLNSQDMNVTFGIRTETLEEQKDSNLSFLQRQDAEAQIREWAGKFIPNMAINKIEIEAYTVEVMEAAKNEMINAYGTADDMKNEFKDSYTQDDEYYYFEVYFSLDQIPVYSERLALLNDSGNYIPQITGIISKNGLESFTVAHVLDIVEEETIEEPIDFYQAYEKLKEKYTQIFFTDQASITKVECNWIVMENFSTHEIIMEPVWIFTMQRKREGIERTFEEETAIQIKDGAILA